MGVVITVSAYDGGYAVRINAGPIWYWTADAEDLNGEVTNLCMESPGAVIDDHCQVIDRAAVESAQQQVHAGIVRYAYWRPA